MEQQRLQDLLEANHSFPGAYQFRAVMVPGTQEVFVERIRAVCTEGIVVTAVRERASRTGKYFSVHVEVHVLRSELVLEAYAAIKEIDGIMMTL
jgi:putative lipoic acid-binding regulatory protein